MNTSNAPRPFSRRRFLAVSSVAAGALTVATPSTAFTAEAHTRLDIGLIGCGGRGGWIAQLFANSGLYNLVACADYFPDRVDRVGDQFKIERSRRYTGLLGYRRLLEGEGKLDAVVIETPPYFHPEQAMAAVEAGKHVFLAKPVAVDAPGCLTIAEAGRLATARKQVLLVDFQTRANRFFREAVAKVHAGAIGELVLAEAHYPWNGGGRGLPPASTEEKLRSWYYVLELSGDFIVEQSIHSLDLVTWIINADPVRAQGGGGRKLRPPGSIWDHFAVHYRFADGLILSFTCIQSIPEIRDEISARVFGAQGMIHADYFSGVTIRSEDPFSSPKIDNLYTTGAQDNIREFHDLVTRGQCDNPTAAASVRSNLAAVLGREAAYRGGELTLEALLKEGKKLEFDLRGLKS